MSSQHNDGSQAQQSSGTPSDDNILVWREVKHYRSLGPCRVDEVYADFREMFDGWTKERFQKVDPEALREMKYALRRAGVYTGPLLMHNAEALANIAQLPCVENGMWPRAPEWDLTELSTQVFIPGSEAQHRKEQQLEMLNRQRDLQPQPALPPAPAPQAPAAQGQFPGQFVTQPITPTPHQAPRPMFHPAGPMLPPAGMQAQPGPAAVQAATPKPPGCPVPAAVPVPPHQVRPSQGMRRLAASQLHAQHLASQFQRARQAVAQAQAQQVASRLQAQQSQQQPGAQPQTNLTQSNSGATRSPQMPIRRTPGAGTNRTHRSEPYPSSNSPFRSTLQHRAAAMPGSQTPQTPTLPVHAQTDAKDDNDNGNGNKN